MHDAGEVLGQCDPETGARCPSAHFRPVLELGAGGAMRQPARVVLRLQPRSHHLGVSNRAGCTADPLQSAARLRRFSRAEV
jgi:hypothetical protein